MTMRFRRGVLRVVALVVMVGALVGVPLVLTRTVGLPLPSTGQLRDAWRLRAVDADLVIAVGAALFLLLWLWFVLTAIGELWHVVNWRRGGGSGALRPIASGPDRWIRELMRFIALSSVAATTVLGGLAPSSKSLHAAPASVVDTPLGVAREVVAGDCYWDIADDQLTASLQRQPSAREVLQYTERLVAFNDPLLGHRDPTLLLPGELVVLVEAAETSEPAAAAAAAAVVAVSEAEDLVPVAAAEAAGPSAVGSYVAGLGTALLLSAGAIGVLESRRRRQWRAAVVGSRLIQPTTAQMRTEKLLRTLDSSERLARLDLALRAAGADLAAQRAAVLAAVLGDDGEVCLFLRGSAIPSDDNWQLDLNANTWKLSAETPLDSLIAKARLCAQPCPALVHVGGVTHGGELFIDLEAVGVLSVVSPRSKQILQHAAASLALSPFMETVRLFTVGLDEAVDVAGVAGDAGFFGGDGVEQVDSLDAALDAAAMSLGSTFNATRAASTLALRVAGAGGESWEPAIVIAAGQHDPSELAHLSVVRSSGRGLAVMIDAAVETGGEGRGWLLRAEGDFHVVEPLGLRLQPVGCDAAEIAAVADLLQAADLQLTPSAPVVHPAAHAAATAPRFVDSEWALMVRVLGPVEVNSRVGVAAEFERSKALELVVWLSQHRRRPTRNSARTALWDLDVRDATFANVVSDARRALARAVTPPTGEEWIARTLSEDLPLHELVVTDAAILAARVDHARGLHALDAIDVLRPGLELLTGMPFAGTGYLWPDAEGITSSLVLLATNAAIELARHYLSLGDVDGVFWATGQGLKVLSGHEELIGLRMRAQARCGDLAGVRHEWETYERALAADPWAAAEPSPKLVALRHELLTATDLVQSRAG